MKTNKIFALLAAVLLPLAVVSCGSEEPEEILPDPTGELIGSFSIVNSDGSTFSMDAV